MEKDYALVTLSHCEEIPRQHPPESDNNSWVSFLFGSPWIMKKLCTWVKSSVWLLSTCRLRLRAWQSSAERENACQQHYKSRSERQRTERGQRGGRKQSCCLSRRCHKIKCLFTREWEKEKFHLKFKFNSLYKQLKGEAKFFSAASYK